MSQGRVIYTPFISKPIPESSAISPIPISHHVSKYQAIDPDKEVIPIQYTSPKLEVDPEPPVEKEATDPFKWAKLILHTPKQSSGNTHAPSGTSSGASISSTSSGSKTHSNNESTWNEIWQQYGSQLGLKDEKAYLYLLGQLKHESGDFNYMEEIADGSAYEGREDLGNTEKGDGRKYKGRGPIQVTGKNNYKKIYEEFFVPNGLGKYNIVENPELGSDPRIGSLMTIGWLYTNPKAIEALNNHDIKASTEAINGGLNGFSDRETITKQLLKEAGLA